MFSLQRLSNFIPRSIIIRSYSARKPKRQTKLSAPIVSTQKLDDGSTFTTRQPTSVAAAVESLPPPIRPIKEKKYHLTEVEVAEIRRLRAEDPNYWTRKKLADKFECSQYFVGFVAPLPQEAIQEMIEKKKQKEERYGERKKLAIRMRQKRRKLW